MVSALAIVGGTIFGSTLTIFLLRQYVSRKWGYFKSNKSLKGQVIIVTGGNVGLGAEVVKDLAFRGATIIIASRSWENTRLFLGEVRQLTGNNDIHFIKLDLGDLASVKEFAEEFNQKYQRLDTLVCNAGLWVPMDKKQKTSDGFEIHAGVNHLGHFHLTNLLLPVLQKTLNSRVVVVSSSLMRQGKFDPEKYDHFHEGRSLEDGAKRGFAPTGYCDSKLMNALFTKQLAARTEGRMTSVCVCPGWCYTSLARSVSIPLYKKVLFLPIVMLFMRSAARGAHNIIHAAVEDADNLVNGGFYRECKVSMEDDTRLEGLTDSGKLLWELSETFSKV
jgi:NAD(P)-dependent dehydrogenase (short-subunit alcohol dehydrogenase family)